MTRTVFTPKISFPKVTIALATAATCLLVPSAIYAQASGQISGTVIDSSGAVVPTAQVTARNLGTNSQRVVKADSAGAYELPISSRAITVSLPLARASQPTRLPFL